MRVRIFLSWSGERSKAAAVALRDWLPLVLHYVDPWLSDRDIAAGDRWAVEIGRELDGTNFGIVVLTTDNLAAPWVLFEAGALSKAFTAASVVPYLIDVDFKDVTGPLAQFQAKKADRASTLELLSAINVKSAKPIDAPRVAQLFDALWPQLAERLSALPPADVKRKPPGNELVLEDLVTAIRRMERRLDQIGASDPRRHDAVIVEVQSSFPRIPEGATLELPPSGDVIDTLASFIGEAVGDYGHSWQLVNDKTGTPVARRAGRALGRRGVAEQLRLVRLSSGSATEADGA